MFSSFQNVIEKIMKINFRSNTWHVTKFNEVVIKSRHYFIIMWVMVIGYKYSIASTPLQLFEFTMSLVELAFTTDRRIIARYFKSYIFCGRLSNFVYPIVQIHNFLKFSFEIRRMSSTLLSKHFLLVVVVFSVHSVCIKSGKQTKLTISGQLTKD